MDIPRFGLGIRFDYLTAPVTESDVRALFGRLCSLLCAKDVEDLDVYGGVWPLSPLDGDHVYTVAFTNGSIKKMRALYRTIDSDAELNAMLCSRMPYLQNNVLRDFLEPEYFGRVDRDGSVTGGRDIGIAFPAKPEKRLKIDDAAHILVAPNSFKGTFTALEAAEHIAAAIRSEMPIVKCELIPVADGGDGTLGAVESMVRGRKRTVQVTAPYGEMIDASYYVIDGEKAVIESALASGLALCKENELDPLAATSRGTGELILRALREGVKQIYIGLGGSATNDCGVGAACALGFRFLDAEGNEVTSADRMGEITSVDASNACPLIKEASFTVMCDVTNPLCGEHGATYTYGPQKGANAETLERLEKGMIKMGALLDAFAGRAVSSMPGAGAAGGMGAMFMALLEAKAISGAEAVLSLARFDERCRKAIMVITGEGRIDSTSVQGKAVGTVLERAAACSRPAALIAGSCGEGAELAERKAWASVYCGEGEDRVCELDKTALTLAKQIRAASFDLGLRSF